MVKPTELIEYLMNRVRVLFGLEKYTELIKDTVSKDYQQGLENVEKELDLNILPDKESVNDLITLSIEQIKDFDQEMTNKLKSELMRGIASGDSNAMVKKRLIGFFSNKPNSSKFNWNDRLNMMLRTERARALNKGTLDGANKSEIKGLRKWVDVVVDDRTSDICMQEFAKYGSPDKSIPLDEPFVVRVKNKTYTAMSPPFHPSCRSELRIDTSGAER